MGFIDQAILVKDHVTGKEVLRYGGDLMTGHQTTNSQEMESYLLIEKKPAMQEVRYYHGLYR